MRDAAEAQLDLLDAESVRECVPLADTPFVGDELVFHPTDPTGPNVLPCGGPDISS